MRRLKIVDPNFGAGNMSRNRQHGNTASMGIEEPVDEMKVAGTAATATDCQLSCQMRFGRRCECSTFFMPHMDPLDRLHPAQGVREAIEGVADNTIGSF